jgi:type II secretory pathway pseudopilin PulG
MPKTDTAMTDTARTRRFRGDGGMTLVEVTITSALLAVVSIVLLSFLESTTKATTRASKDVQAEQTMTIALRSMAQEIRSASAFSQCSGSKSYKTCLTFSVPRNTALGLDCPSRTITYELVSGTVRETRVTYPANACSPTTTTFNSRPLLENVVNTSAQPLFTYYTTSGTAFDPDLGTTSVDSSAGSIKTEVFVNYGAVNSPTISLSSMAALRNQR